jgi:hypothetical protein
LIADAHEADVGSQSDGTIKLNFIRYCLAIQKMTISKAQFGGVGEMGFPRQLQQKPESDVLELAGRRRTSPRSAQPYREADRSAERLASAKRLAVSLIFLTQIGGNGAGTKTKGKSPRESPNASCAFPNDVDFAHDVQQRVRW